MCTPHVISIYLYLHVTTPARASVQSVQSVRPVRPSAEICRKFKRGTVGGQTFVLLLGGTAVRVRRGGDRRPCLPLLYQILIVTSIRISRSKRSCKDPCLQHLPPNHQHDRNSVQHGSATSLASEIFATQTWTPNDQLNEHQSRKRIRSS